MRKVSIILVNYNGYRDTVECIKSLQGINYDNYEIIVVDNGSSSHPTKDELAYIKAYTKLIETGVNLGFSGGNNVGISYALEHGAEFVLLLNNDTTVDSDFLTILVNAAVSKEKVGIVGGKIKYYSEPQIIWFGGGGYDETNGYVWHERYNQLDSGNTGEIKEQTCITGCLMLIPVTVLKKVGLLDERFFLYAEDTEFSCRVRRAGYKLWFCEDAVIYHKVSASTGAGSFNTTYYSTRNILYVAKDYCSNMWKCYLNYGWLWGKKIIKGSLKIRPVLKGLIDFKKNVTGEYLHK